MTLKEIKNSLTKDQLLWLDEVYKRTEGLKKVNKNELIRDLHGKLSKSFSIDDLSPTFFINNSNDTRESELTLFGVYLCDNNSSIVQDLDRIILEIKDSLLNDPHKTKFEASYFEEKLSLEYDYVTKVLGYFIDLKLFWSGAGGVPNKYAYKMVETGGDSKLFNLLRYESIHDTILDSLVNIIKNKNPNRSGEYYQTIESNFFKDSDLKEEPTSSYSDTAFIIMQMNKDTIDTKHAIKDVCKEFGIKAIRADDIEHSDVITKKILEYIKKSELLIADLTGARPNVYYEIGFAHALNKKPILYREKGAKLHFDLSVHNVPEYDNNTDLKDRLRDRLEAVLGRKAEEN